MRRRRQLLGALLKKLFVPVKVLEAILIEHNLAWVANRQLMRSEHKLPSGRCCTWLWYCCAGWRQKLPMRRVVSSYTRLWQTGAQGEMCFRVAEVSIQCDRCETQWRRWMHRARTGPRVAPTVSNSGFCAGMSVDRRCGQIGVHSKIILRSEPRIPGTVLSTSGEVVLFLDLFCACNLCPKYCPFGASS